DLPHGKAVLPWSQSERWSHQQARHHRVDRAFPMPVPSGLPHHVVSYSVKVCSRAIPIFQDALPHQFRCLWLFVNEAHMVIDGQDDFVIHVALEVGLDGEVPEAVSAVSTLGPDRKAYKPRIYQRIAPLALRSQSMPQ